VRITADSDSHIHHDVGCSIQSGEKSSIVLTSVDFDGNRAPTKPQMCTGALDLLKIKDHNGEFSIW